MRYLTLDQELALLLIEFDFEKHLMGDIAEIRVQGGNSVGPRMLRPIGCESLNKGGIESESEVEEVFWIGLGPLGPKLIHKRERLMFHSNHHVQTINPYQPWPKNITSAAPEIASDGGGEANTSTFISIHVFHRL